MAEFASKQKQFMEKMETDEGTSGRFLKMGLFVYFVMHKMLM